MSIIKDEENIPVHVVAVFAFIEKQGKILLAKRDSSDPQAPGVWSVPGGKVEIEVGHDILLKTIKREIREEVGIEIEDNVTYISDDGFFRVSGHHVVGLVFLCRWKKGIARPLEDQEEVRWFSKRELKNFDQLPDYFIPRVKKILKLLK